MQFLGCVTQQESALLLKIFPPSQVAILDFTRAFRDLFLAEVFCTPGTGRIRAQFSGCSARSGRSARVSVTRAQCVCASTRFFDHPVGPNTQHLVLIHYSLVVLSVVVNSLFDSPARIFSREFKIVLTPSTKNPRQ